MPPYDETVNYINKINDILGGVLANDSTTVDGAYATDFTSASDVNALIQLQGIMPVNIQRLKGQEAVIRNRITVRL